MIRWAARSARSTSSEWMCFLFFVFLEVVLALARGLRESSGVYSGRVTHVCFLLARTEVRHQQNQLRVEPLRLINHACHVLGRDHTTLLLLCLCSCGESAALMFGKVRDCAGPSGA